MVAAPSVYTFTGEEFSKQSVVCPGSIRIRAFAGSSTGIFAIARIVLDSLGELSMIDCK